MAQGDTKSFIIYSNSGKSSSYHLEYRDIFAEWYCTGYSHSLCDSGARVIV